MSDLVQQIADNVSRVRERIASAALAAGRLSEEVQLVAVTKYVGPVEAAAILAAHCKVLGESRPQQLAEKSAEPALADAQWHLIGHLQRNKVRRTLPLVDLIHSVDSPRLLQSIEQIAAELNQKVTVLLEVNCSGDAAKHGLSPDDLKQLLSNLPRLTHVKIRGLMTMAAREGGVATAAKNFAMLRQLRDSLYSESPPEVALQELSMGMSHDFEVAIREGATFVRICSILFDGVLS